MESISSKCRILHKLSENNIIGKLLTQYKFRCLCMADCVWNITIDYLPRVQTINATVYSFQIDQVHEQLIQRRACLVNRKGILLFNDVARTLAPLETRSKLITRDILVEKITLYTYHINIPIGNAQIYIFLLLKQFKLK